MPTPPAKLASTTLTSTPAGNIRPNPLRRARGISITPSRLAQSLLLALPMWANAVQVCDVDGQHVNPANGHTTAGKTGLMRCRTGEGGPVVREQELRNGVFMGVVRHYREGVLRSEHQVNERGNRDGVAREYAATPSGTNQLLREETLRNGTTIGLARSWHASGALRRVAFHADDGREQAVAEFTRQGRLSELRCGAQGLLLPDFDDGKACGHQASNPATVTLHREDGNVHTRLTLLNGERRKIETLWDNGQLRDQREFTAEGGSERSFSASGVKRRELQWSRPTDRTRTGRIVTLEQEFHETGTLVRERRWRATERGSEQVLEQTWYLNGQPREKLAYQTVGPQTQRLQTLYHDDGRVAAEGLWIVKGRHDVQASGVHRHFDTAGRLRRELHHDARGRVNRERDLDEAGNVVRDDEVFEDGSRKSVGR